MLALAFVLAGLPGLDAVPRAQGDECWYAMPTVSLLRDGSLRMAALEGRGGVARAYLQPKILPNLLAAPVVAVAGVHLRAFRFTALLCTAAALLCVEALGRRRLGADAGLAAAGLLALNYWCFAGARCFRPEAFELAALAWFALELDDALDTRRAPPIVRAGIAAAAAALCHQVAAALVVAIALAWTLAEAPRRGRCVTAALVGLVAAVAASPYLIYVAVASRGDLAAAYLQLTGESEGRHLTLAGTLYFEAQRWASYFHWPYGALAAVVGAVAVARALRAGPGFARRVALGIVAGAATFAVAVPVFTGRYLLALAPFLALLVARELVTLRAEGSGSRVRRLLPWALALAYVGPSLAVTVGVAVAHRGGSQARMIRTLRAVTGDAPVAGPVVFWVGYHDVPYTVTNVAPDFGHLDPRRLPWLAPRIARDRPRFLLETTSTLQSTGGLAPRPQSFPRSAVGELAARVGSVVAVVPSRDFGPVRVWRLDHPERATAP